jgi:hypothetical protein
MTNGFTTDGFKALIDHFQRLQSGLVPALAEQMHERAQMLLVTSQPLVPVVTGALQQSGEVLPPEVSGPVITVDITYGGPDVPYAQAVHENERSGRTGGYSPSGIPYPEGSYATSGQAHFLSAPTSDLASTFSREVASWVGALTRRMMGQGG